VAKRCVKGCEETLDFEDFCLCVCKREIFSLCVFVCSSVSKREKEKERANVERTKREQYKKSLQK
jgi:hypothetical protein